MCNQLGQKRLDTQICIGEEGVNNIDFNPDQYIKKWYTNKVPRINGAKHNNYPSKCQSADSSTSSGYTVTNTTSVTVSALESGDKEFEEF